MKPGFHTVILFIFATLITACRPEHTSDAPSPTVVNPADTIFRVGSVVVRQGDLDFHLKENHNGRNDEDTRRIAISDLAERAQLVHAAIDEGLAHDPMVRAEMARILASRLKEKNLFPKLKDASDKPIPEARLKEIYTANSSKYRSVERRQVAVLWLNPKGNWAREKQYVEKLKEARGWFFDNSGLENHPERGFSTLGVDYSEHQSSRYADGVVGWFEKTGGMDSWSKALADIVFSLEKPGAVSEVISRPEGVFLVRFMAVNLATLRPFEAVSSELEAAERHLIRKQTEAEFNTKIKQSNPVQWIKP